MSEIKSKKSFPKTILITLILVVLITGGYFAIRSNQAKNEIKNQIISTMENAIDRGIYIGKVENYSLNSITLSNFKIFKNRSLLDEDQIFEAEEIIVNYDLDILSALKKKTALNIEDITLVKPRMTLVRDKQGIFDFIEKFNFNSDNFAVSLKRVNFQDGNLDYIDYQTTKENGLLTKVKSLNGYFYLGNLPKVEFDCSGLREEDNTPLALKGYFFANNSSGYSLDFNFKDADITHFQYYFAETRPFNLKKGLFDLNLHLANDSDTTKGEIIWYGQASARDVDLFPDFLDGMELNQAQGSATFDSKETIIEKVTALYKNSPFTLKGVLTYIDEFNYNIKVKSDDFKLSDLGEGLKEYVSLSQEFQAKGKSNLSFEVSGSEEIFQVQGELLSEQGEIQGYDFSRLRTEFNYDRDGFCFKNMKAEVGEGVVEGTGKIILKDELLSEYDLLFNLAQFDVESDFLKSLHLDYLKKGLLSGKVEIRGIVAQDEKMNLSAEAKVKNEAGILSLNAEGTIAENNYLNLKINTAGINLEELGEILNYQEIKGLANFTGQLSGLPDNLKIKGKIEAREGQISELPFDYLEGKIDYQSSKLKLEELVFKNEGLGLKGNGSIDFAEGKDTETNFVFKVEQADIGYLAKLYNYDFPISALAQGEIIIDGIWPKITTHGDLKLKDIDLISYRAESGSLIFVLEENKIKVKSMVLNSGKTQLYTQGEVNLEEGFPLDLRVNFLNQDISSLLSNFVKSDLIGKLRGKATGSLEIKGNYASPDLYLSSLIEDVQLEKVPLNSIEVKLEKIGPMIRVNQLKLSQRKGELIAWGWINLDEDNKNLDIHLSADNVDLSQLSNLFGIEDEIKGLVNFEAEVTGDIDLPNISFSAKVEKGKFQDFIFDNLTFEALYNQDILEVKQFVLDKEGHQIIGKGKIPYEFSSMGKEKVTSSLTDIPIDFILTLENTDLSFISMFFKEDIKQIQGLTNAELELSGTLNQPILNGNIALADAEVELFQFPTKINGLNVSLRLEDNLVKIEDMNFQIDQYRIYTSGEFALKNLQPQDLDINIWTNKEEILYQDIFQAQADLKAKVTGLITSPHIEGILTLSQAELNWKDNNKDVPTDPSELLSKLINLKGDIDLEVKILDDFIAKTNDFNLKLVGGLKVQGALSAPKLNGELEIKQGHITFLDKKFRVSAGKVIFADSTGEDMILDIRAKTEIDDIDVFVSISGILAQPMVTFISSPVLSESEIISLLMFNKNYAGLTEGELGEILKEEMLNLIAQGISLTFLNQIENQVASSLGLDEFNLETIFKKEESTELTINQGLTLAGLALKMGKYFSENFYLTYSTPLYEAGKGSLEFEYKVKDDLTLSTQIGSTGSQENEFELKFELQYEF